MHGAVTLRFRPRSRPSPRTSERVALTETFLHMKTLYDPERAAEVKARIARLTPGSERKWGTMTAAQVVSHCVRGMQMATGELRIPRIFIGRLIGWKIKSMVLRDDAPFRRNSPTARELVVKGEPDLETGRAQLLAEVDRFALAGPAGCTTHPHPFFGRMTPDEWALLGYKHLDHHLRQFGV